MAQIRVLKADAVSALPRPGWLIKGILEDKSLSMLYGKEGSQKTFVALDMAFHITLGWEWHGHKVKAGTNQVVYVIGEGAAGVRHRIEAFKKHYNLAEVPNAFVVIESVDIVADVEALAAQINEVAPQAALIVLDTFARCYSGDENDAAAMKNAVAKCDQLRAKTNAAVMLVHHATKNLENPTFRGSTVLSAAMDVMIEVKPKGKTGSTLTCMKMKNYKPFEKVTFRLTEVELPPDAEDDISGSCVLTRVSDAEENDAESVRTVVGRSVLTNLPDQFKTKEFKAAYPASGRQAERTLEALCREGIVERVRTGVYRKGNPDTANTPPNAVLGLLAPDGPTDTDSPLKGLSVWAEPDAGIQVLQ